MNNWPVYHIKNLTAEQSANRGFRIHCEELYNQIKPKRAEAIEAALSVEGALDMVLLDLLVGKDESRRDVLREHVLFPEFCTSMQKWKMLKRLVDTFPEYFKILNNEQLTELKRDIKELMDDRNKFAHGDLFVDGQEFHVELRYYENGTKWLQVNHDYFNGLIEKAFRSSKSLQNLHKTFKSDDSSKSLV
jgi:hypothetical protein